MDCLFAKYGSPFLFMDGVLQIRRFSEFVDQFIEEENDKQLWEFYLHKVYDKSFKDFKESILEKPISEEQLETTIQDSKNIMLNFTPEE